jgi:predicted  nucleic acid-binding Zn-ribbon protein
MSYVTLDSSTGKVEVTVTSHDQHIRELKERIDELEVENADQSFRMREAAGLVEEVKTDVIRLEAKVKKLARLERIAIKWHKNNGRFENQLYAAIEEIMFEVIE